jgi:hypothetical protein
MYGPVIHPPEGGADTPSVRRRTGVGAQAFKAVNRRKITLIVALLVLVLASFGGKFWGESIVSPNLPAGHVANS